jgi:hypothetical protein
MEFTIVTSVEEPAANGCNKILDGLPSSYGVSTNPRPAPNPKP